MNLGTYNIRDSGAFSLPHALRAVQMENYDLVLLTETKIPDAVYYKNSLRYNIVCSWAATTAAGEEQGSMGLVMRERPYGWDAKSMHFHRPNMVSCEIVSSLQKKPLTGSYPHPTHVYSVLPP